MTDVTPEQGAGPPAKPRGLSATASHGRVLSQGISTTVRGLDEGPAELTASFEGVPSEHDGQTAFTLRMAFSEPLSLG